VIAAELAYEASVVGCQGLGWIELRRSFEERERPRQVSDVEIGAAEEKAMPGYPGSRRTAASSSGTRL
jgi:hypothetical protein